MQDWDNRNDMYYFPIIPKFHYSTIPCGLVIHTFGADMKWHPHIHLIVTAGGLSLDGKRWIATDPKFLMYHGGLKKRWKYQVTTRMKRAHREGQWRFLSEPLALRAGGQNPKISLNNILFLRRCLTSLGR